MYRLVTRCTSLLRWNCAQHKLATGRMTKPECLQKRLNSRSTRETRFKSLTYIPYGDRLAERWVRNFGHAVKSSKSKPMNATSPSRPPADAHATPLHQYPPSATGQPTQDSNRNSGTIIVSSFNPGDISQHRHRPQALKQAKADLRLRCTALDVTGKIQVTAGEFSKSDLIAEVSLDFGLGSCLVVFTDCIANIT